MCVYSTDRALKNSKAPALLLCMPHVTVSVTVELLASSLLPAATPLLPRTGGQCNQMRWFQRFLGLTSSHGVPRIILQESKWKITLVHYLNMERARVSHLPGPTGLESLLICGVTSNHPSTSPVPSTLQKPRVLDTDHPCCQFEKPAWQS